ncbi:glycosyltransferase family 4 protein [Myroides indicus]|uniref:Glycosyltransferase involved in cell wall biosynthesis n=1 Tax=Myroides indicus TaxID=1323422 RepID=A0A4R7F5U5_9FLAO|nr:glycosyltransferase family 4 protein [Myroides indicus]TDS65014.1 glycosyltransferase involved in cell wall biosynthesis [Myroides indicus]
MIEKKIIVISSLSSSLVNFRFDLLKELVKHGYEVVALGPEKDADTIKTLTSIGVRFRVFSLERNGFNPIKDINTIRELRKIYKEEKPDFILPYTVKPVVYSNIAKIGSNIKSLNWITGLGFYGLESKTFRDKISKSIMTFLYKLSFKKNDIVVFQNNDDLMYFKDKGILKYRNTITPGSGINIEKYSYSLPQTEIIKFIFVGRLIKAKGIDVFIKAAEILKDKYNNIEFTVVGAVDEGNPEAIQKEEYELLREKGFVNFTGHVNNVIDYVRESSVFVLPSIYREGVPRSILEAMALGRAIITTDNVGCRETVIKDYNGILIEKNNVSNLIEAMEFFCKNQDLIIEYGKNSRLLAESKFDVKIVNNIILESLKDL